MTAYAIEREQAEVGGKQRGGRGCTLLHREVDPDAAAWQAGTIMTISIMIVSMIIIIIIAVVVIIMIAMIVIIHCHCRHCHQNHYHCYRCPQILFDT